MRGSADLSKEDEFQYLMRMHAGFTPVPPQPALGRRRDRRRHPRGAMLDPTSDSPMVGRFSAPAAADSLKEEESQHGQELLFTLAELGKSHPICICATHGNANLINEIAKKQAL